MVDKYIYRGNKKYYYHSTHNTWRKAYNMARYYKRTTGTKYWINKVEAGLWFPREKYRLYFTKVQRIY